MGEVAAGWLMLGVVLHLANQVTRGRGWYAIVRAACGCDAGVRRRDAIAAWIAGAGAGGLFSARGGDAVRVLLLRRRVPDAGCPLLAGTLVAEGAGEIAGGALLLALAVAIGVGPELGAAPAVPVALAVAGTLVVLVALMRRSPRLRRIAAGIGRGCAPLRAPGAYARGVLPWQLASRACRLGSLACFLAAFSLPASFAAVLLVAFAQGGGRLVPFAPASVGASVALLAAGFGPVTGSAVAPERLAAFLIGTSTVLTVVGIALALAICLRSQASASRGRSVRTVLAEVTGRSAIARAATIPAP